MGRFDDFDAYIQDVLASWHCPGAAIAVIRGSDTLHRGAYGTRDAENGLPMTDQTRFPMASVTKSFTAMSIALLVDDGKLEWDKPVREVAPEFVLNDPYVSEHFTVRDMLSHRTGLPRHDMSAIHLDISRAEFVKRMRHLKFNRTLRELWQYNNLMYYAAGYLVDKLSGQRWEQFVQERIFTPLGMQASNFQPEPPRPGQVNAEGYRVERDAQGGFKNWVHMPPGAYTELSPGSAGALFSTLADLVEWLKLHVNGGRVGDMQLVAPDTLKQMHLPQMVVPTDGMTEALSGNTISTYGMGWFIEPYRGRTLISHGGDLEGHSLVIAFVPEEQLGIVVLTNIAGLPTRDVLLYESLDRGLDLSERGWNTKYHNLFDPIFAAQATGKQTSAAEQVPDAPASHPLSAYAGEYAAPGYPDFAVRLTDDGLQACTVGSFPWSELRHYHYDVFEWRIESFDVWIKLRFLLNFNGEVDAVSLPIEPEVEDVLFTRKQPTLSQDVIAALLGEYDTPIAGLALTVTTHDGKVFATQTGGAPEQIVPYKLTDELVGFRLKRSRYEFTREAGPTRRLVLKTPDLTIEAVRRSN